MISMSFNSTQIPLNDKITKLVHEIVLWYMAYTTVEDISLSRFILQQNGFDLALNVERKKSKNPILRTKLPFFPLSPGSS